MSSALSIKQQDVLKSRNANLVRMQPSAKDSGQIRFQQRCRCLVDAISCFVCQMESQFKLTDIGVLACYFVTMESRRKELQQQWFLFAQQLWFVLHLNNLSRKQNKNTFLIPIL